MSRRAEPRRSDAPSAATIAPTRVRALWGRYWIVPAVPLLYAAVMLAIGDLRPEHVIFGLGCAALGYAGPRSKAFFVDISPYVLVAICYDMVRYARLALVSAERVLGCELRDLELAWFSVAPGVTPQDWFAIHHTAFWDLVFAVPYAFFAYAALGYAAYLYFVDRPRMRHYLWAFALANLISFVVWLALPAAPPWYIRQHGCAIDLAVQPSPAGLARVDTLLGIEYFKTFYSRAASVFGALPSMHCAYPMLGLLTARRAASWRTWPIHVGYVLAMFSASVYLDHHWIIDGIFGWALALFAVGVTEVCLKRMGWLPSLRSAAPAKAQAIESA